MFKVKNGLAPDYIMELFRNSNKGYSLRNADFDLPRFSSVHYGKHSIRYLGPYLWSRLSAVDRKRLTIGNCRNSIRDKDLTALIDDACSYCAYVLLEIRQFTYVSTYHFFYFYLFNCSLVKYNNVFVSLETVF